MKIEPKQFMRTTIKKKIGLKTLVLDLDETLITSSYC